MKIYVKDVPPEGMAQRATYDPVSLDMEREDVHLRESFEAEAFVTKADRELVVAVAMRAPLNLICSRCLKEFTVVVTPQTVFSYTVQPTDTVDITDDVRQEIILAYPMIPLCRPDCKGLCGMCGQELNMAPCSHEGQ